MWDYLIVTASNEQQADGYRRQLQWRIQLGLMSEVRHILVVADPDGKRVGSGGSTLFCLLEVLKQFPGSDAFDLGRLRQIFGALRILIIHAGGDSKRLPAYGPCGKIFVPMPGESDRCLPMTLFDRQLPTYLALPPAEEGSGQVVITSGDVMLRFDPQQVRFNRPGLTGLGCYAPPSQAAHHGVYCGADESGQVRRFLQKPTPAQQQALGAIDPYGRSVLDIGVMQFDADTAVRLLELFGLRSDNEGNLLLSGDLGQAVMDFGLDFYREICCALGSEVTLADYVKTVRDSGSGWDEPRLAKLLQSINQIRFNLQLLDHCDFIDFGTTARILQSGSLLVQQDRSASQWPSCMEINNAIDENGRVLGKRYWAEGCRIQAAVTLAGDNVVTGVDIAQPLKLPAGACLDVISGLDSGSGSRWFVRCYGVNDAFKEPLNEAVFCGIPIQQWLVEAGASESDLFDSDIPLDKHTLWDARLFPSIYDPAQYDRWLWMFEPKGAADAQRAEWKKAPRFSLAEIVQLSDADTFFKRRLSLRAEYIKHNLCQFFRPESEFSAAELAFLLEQSKDQVGWIMALISQAKWNHGRSNGLEKLAFPRLIHTVATVLETAGPADQSIMTALPELSQHIGELENDWLQSVGLSLNSGTTAKQWSKQARQLAFTSLSGTIINTDGEQMQPPVNRLRSDEIVWGRAPARFDTGGGWTDTPPYSLEYGGCVVNAAVDLNGQSPIQAYLRVIAEPVITIGSIDLGTRIRITDLDGLLDYGSPTSQYGLVKAALALSGFSTGSKAWLQGISLERMLSAFGGGIEITTLAAIPKGSGLGTSSIMGAVILAVIHRAMGRQLTHRQLFNKVLQLEQALTTGGGWQDQVGGIVGGVKIVSTHADLLPDPRIHYLPSDLIDPVTNRGMTLLFYTGITRLAKNILEQVVGRYLDRNRKSMVTLRKISDLTGQVADALSRKDLPAFGRLMNTAWDLNKELDPNSTNDQVDTLFSRVRPYIYGAKLLGAGGGGFMLMVCKSVDDAQKIRTMLENDPPNERSRFFDYNVNHQGLVVTVC